MKNVLRSGKNAGTSVSEGDYFEGDFINIDFFFCKNKSSPYFLITPSMF